MTLDRRPIFTVGMVWTQLVKRLPRSSPRYRIERPSFSPDLLEYLGGLQALSSIEQQQQLALQRWALMGGTSL